MTYQFYRARSDRPVIVPLRDDLAARRAASLTTDIVRVETPDGRVVWRRAEEEIIN
jgi:hypothetical protein